MDDVYTKVSILLCSNLGVGVWYMGNVFTLIWGWCLMLGVFVMFISSGDYVVGKFIFFKFINVVCCLQHFVHVLTFAILWDKGCFWWLVLLWFFCYCWSFVGRVKRWTLVKVLEFVKDFILMWSNCQVVYKCWMYIIRSLMGPWCIESGGGMSVFFVGCL